MRTWVLDVVLVWEQALVPPWGQVLVLPLAADRLPVVPEGPCFHPAIAARMLHRLLLHRHHLPQSIWKIRETRSTF
jgi:hypothetical protein